MKYSIYKIIYEGCIDGIDNYYTFKHIGYINIPSWACHYKSVKKYWAKKELKKMGLQTRDVALVDILSLRIPSSLDVERMRFNNEFFVEDTY